MNDPDRMQSDSIGRSLHTTGGYLFLECSSFHFEERNSKNNVSLGRQGMGLRGYVGVNLSLGVVCRVVGR